MNGRLSLGVEEASDGGDDSESDSGVLHQYEDIYKLRCQSYLLNISKSCLQRGGGGEKGPRWRFEAVLFCSDISQCDGYVPVPDANFAVLEFLWEERWKVYFPTMRKCKTFKL